jgi:hypothetical protein
MRHATLALLPAASGGNMGRAVASMHRVLASVGWDDLADPSTTSVAVRFAASDGPVRDAAVAIEPHAECFIATFNFGGRAPPATREAIARFATRANWELMAGNFELDVEDGSVRFRSAVPFSGAELSESMIRSVIGAAVAVVEAYAQAVEDVMEGRSDADSALEGVWRASARQARHDA